MTRIEVNRDEARMIDIIDWHAGLRAELRAALQLRDQRRGAAAWAKADRRITDQALWVPTANIHAPELVSSRVRNFQFHPVWDFIADQAWLR